MVRSESDLHRMTKRELIQWLTKHGQRMPRNEKLKKYYLERAVTYFRLLQKEKNPCPKQRASRRYNERIKAKYNLAAPQYSKTPTTSVRQTEKRIQRIHSAAKIHQSPCVTRYNRKVIKVKRKTPKQSPSLSRAIKNKRERVRRATADPVRFLQLQQEMEINANKNQDTADDDDDEAQSANDDEIDVTDLVAVNEVDSHDLERTNNLIKKKFVCCQDVEKMAISSFQARLDENSTDLQRDQKKQNGFNLVKYSHPLSSSSGPDAKTMQATRSRINEKHRQQEPEQSQEKSGMELTPISKFITASKLEMRDKIRRLLDDDDSLRSLKITNDGMTPGGPCNYDTDELNNELSDLLPQNNRKQLYANSPGRVKVFYPKSPPKEQPSAAVAPDNDNSSAVRKAETAKVLSILTALSEIEKISISTFKHTDLGKKINNHLKLELFKHIANIRETAQSLLKQWETQGNEERDNGEDKSSQDLKKGAAHKAKFKSPSLSADASSTQQVRSIDNTNDNENEIQRAAHVWETGHDLFESQSDQDRQKKENMWRYGSPFPHPVPKYSPSAHEYTVSSLRELKQERGHDAETWAQLDSDGNCMSVAFQPVNSEHEEEEKLYSLPIKSLCNWRTDVSGQQKSGQT